MTSSEFLKKYLPILKPGYDGLDAKEQETMFRCDLNELLCQIHADGANQEKADRMCDAFFSGRPKPYKKLLPRK